MRLLLVCLVVFLAPAAALIVTERSVSTIEGEFWSDSASQIARLERVTALYPPNVRKMRSAPAIVQLKSMPSGGHVAAAVCATYDSPYRRLFDHLNTRCAQWSLFSRARRAAMAGAVLAIATLASVLLARIVVRRYSILQEWPDNWTVWFMRRGMPALLLAQISAALLGFGVLLQDYTGKALTAAAILLIPFVALYWIERRLVLAFIEWHTLAAFRPKAAARRRRRRIRLTA